MSDHRYVSGPATACYNTRNRHATLEVHALAELTPRTLRSLAADLVSIANTIDRGDLERRLSGIAEILDAVDERRHDYDEIEPEELEEIRKLAGCDQ